MNIFQLLFGFSGRINRAKFWVAVLVYVVVFFGGMMIAMAASASASTMYGVLLVLYVPILISGIAVGIKRLHDRNKSAWWLLVFLGGPFLVQLAGLAVPESAGDLPFQVLVLASFAINIWMLVEFGCLRGSIGPNQYGPDPVAPAAAALR